MIREDRYIVIKKSDLDYALKPKHVSRLQKIYEKYQTWRGAAKERLECVVVEQDWPEHETVWRMIEARVDGDEISAANLVAAFIDNVKLHRNAWLKRYQEENDWPMDQPDTDVVTPYDHLLYGPVADKPGPTFAQKLHGLIGYVENGTDTSIHIYHDDATRTVHIDGKSWHEYGTSLEHVVELAYQEHAEKFE